MADTSFIALRLPQNAPASQAASSPLLSAALAGLLGAMPATLATGCGDDDDATDGDTATETGSEAGATETPTNGAVGTDSMGTGSMGGGDDDDDAMPTTDEPRVISTTKAPADLTLARFTADCEAKGGYLETHATCSGANSCAGLSYNKFDGYLTEHTCAGLNTCGGMSCVVGPADQGRTGEAIYKASCEGCHGDKGFTLFVPKGTDLAEAEAKFLDKTALTMESIVAFGTQGVNPTGTHFSNMPSFRRKYARKEISRVVAHLRSLKPKASEYTTLGYDEEFKVPQ